MIFLKIKIEDNHCCKIAVIFCLHFYKFQIINAKDFDYIKFAHITPISQNFHLRYRFFTKNRLFELCVIGGKIDTGTDELGLESTGRAANA